MGAYLTGVAVTSGPWLITTLVLVLLRVSALRTGIAGIYQVELVITIVYATVLVFSAPANIVMSRFASDRMYEERADQIAAPLRRYRGVPYFRVATFVALALLAAGTNAAWAERPAFKVAAIQFNPELGVLKKRKNVDALAERFEEAAECGAKIIVAPEMATTGYLYLDRTDIAKVVETIPGPTTQRFEKIARKYGCYLVWGMPERDATTGLFYNSAAIVGPEGFVEKYRKTHLWESEAHWSAWGDMGVPVFDTRFGRVALLICQDANYVETFRLAALRKADIVCFLTNSSGQTVGHLQARAIQNGVFIVSANRSNSEVDPYDGEVFEMQGCSAIWSPTGEKLAEASRNGEETVDFKINPAAFRRREDRLDERRPETYKDLALHIAPWNKRASTKPRSIEAIAVQYFPAPEKFDENRKLVEQMLAVRLGDRLATNGIADGQAAAETRVRLIVLPELSLIGRADADEMYDLAEELDDGRTHRWAVELAKRYKAFIVCGLPERDGKDLFNTAIVVSPDGKRIGHARKVHLNPYDENWASAANQWRVIHAEPLGRLGILIGTDSYSPEAGTIMAINRADVVAVPASWHGEIAGKGAIAIDPEVNPHAKRNAMVLWDDMAWGQQFYTVVANTASRENQPGGRSGIYSTDPIYGIESPAFAVTDENEVVVGLFQTLNPLHWIDQHRYIGSRRADSIYNRLLKPVAPRPAQRAAPAKLVP